jgi:hypothetical protein
MPKSARRTKTSKSRSTSNLNRIQDLQVSAVRRVSEAVARLVPPLPRPSLADRLPGARRVVNGNFDRAHRLLEKQRQFTLALVDAVEPVTRKLGERKGPKKKSARPGATQRRHAPGQ